MFVEIRERYLKEPLPLPLVVHTVGFSGPVQSTVRRPLGFASHHLLIVERGEGWFQLGEEVFSLSAGEGVLCRRGVSHAYGAEGDSFRTCWLTFLGGESVLDYYKIGSALRFEVSPAQITALAELETFCRGNSTPLTRSAAGYTWLTDWLHRCFSPSASVEIRVRRYLEAHFAEDLSLEEIADQVELSRYALCHYYKTHCNTTVMDQLRKIRIAKAKQMLRLSSTSVEEIGYSCGFQSPGYFAKIFKEETGCTPREYRGNEKGKTF